MKPRFAFLSDAMLESKMLSEIREILLTLVVTHKL